MIENLLRNIAMISLLIITDVICSSPHRSLKWELAVQERLAEVIPTFEHLNISRFGSQTLKKELDVNTMSVMPYMTATVGVMLIFSMITASMTDWVRSKPLLGMMGVMSAALACCTAFGILMYCQLEFIGINMAAPFLMLGKYLCRRGMKGAERIILSNRILGL